MATVLSFLVGCGGNQISVSLYFHDSKDEYHDMYFCYFDEDSTKFYGAYQYIETQERRYSQKGYDVVFYASAGKGADRIKIINQDSMGYVVNEALQSGINSVYIYYKLVKLEYAILFLNDNGEEQVDELIYRDGNEEIFKFASIEEAPVAPTGTVKNTGRVIIGWEAEVNGERVQVYDADGALTVELGELYDMAGYFTYYLPSVENCLMLYPIFGDAVTNN